MARRMQETGRGAGRRRRRGGPRRRSPPGLLRRSSTVKTLLQAYCGAGEEARPERLPLRGSVGEQGCGLQECPSRRFGEEDGASRFGSGEDEAGRFGSGDAPSSVDVGRRRAEQCRRGEEARRALSRRRWGGGELGGGVGSASGWKKMVGRGAPSQVPPAVGRSRASAGKKMVERGAPSPVPPTVGSLEGRRVPPTVGSLEGRRGRRVQDLGLGNFGFGFLDGEGSRGPLAGHGNGIRVTETMAKQCSDVFLRVGG
jgi:hypothetical protein